MSNFWGKTNPASNDVVEDTKQPAQPNKGFWGSLNNAPAPQVDALGDYEKTRRAALAQGQNAFAKQTAAQAIDNTANAPLPPTVPATTPINGRSILENAASSVPLPVFVNIAKAGDKIVDLIAMARNSTLPKDENGNPILPKPGVFGNDLAGFEQEVSGLPMMAKRAIEGAFKGYEDTGGVLHPAAEAVDYAFNPTHTYTGKFYDFNNPTPTDMVWQIAGATQAAALETVLTGGLGAGAAGASLAAMTAAKKVALDKLAEATADKALPTALKSGAELVAKHNLAEAAAKEAAAKAAYTDAKQAIPINAAKAAVYSGAKNTAGAAGGMALTGLANNIPGIELDKRIANADWLSPQQKQDVATLAYSGIGLAGGLGTTKGVGALGERFSSLGDLRDAVIPAGQKTYRKAREEDILSKAGETQSEIIKTPSEMGEELAPEVPETRKDTDIFAEEIPETPPSTEKMEEGAEGLDINNSAKQTALRGQTADEAIKTLEAIKQNLYTGKKTLTEPLKNQKVRVENPTLKGENLAKDTDALKQAYNEGKELPTTTPLEPDSKPISQSRINSDSIFQVDKDTGNYSLLRSKVDDLAAQDLLTDTTSNVISTLNHLQSLDNYVPSKEYNSKLQQLLPAEEVATLSPEAQAIKDKAQEAVVEPKTEQEPNGITHGVDQLTGELNNIFNEAHQATQDGNTIPQEQLNNWLKDNGIEDLKKVQDPEGKISAELLMHEMQSNKLLEGSANLASNKKPKRGAKIPVYDQSAAHAAHYLHTIGAEHLLSEANANKLAKVYTDVKQNEQAKQASHKEFNEKTDQLGKNIDETLGHIFHPVPEEVRGKDGFATSKDGQRQKAVQNEVYKHVGQALGDENGFHDMIKTLKDPNAPKEAKRQALGNLSTLFTHMGKVMKADVGAGFGHVPLSSHFTKMANDINEIALQSDINSHIQTLSALQSDINSHIQTLSPTGGAITPKQIREFQKQIKADSNKSFLDLPNGKKVDLTYQGNSTKALQDATKAVFDNDNLYSLHLLGGKDIPAASVLSIIDRISKSIQTGDMTFGEAQKMVTSLNHMKKYRQNIHDEIDKILKPLQDAVDKSIEEHYENKYTTPGAGKVAVEAHRLLTEAQRRNMDAGKTHQVLEYGKIGTAGNDVGIGEFGTGKGEQSLPQKFEENMSVIDKANAKLRQLGVNGVPDTHIANAKKFQQSFTDLLRNDANKGPLEALINQSGTMAAREKAPTSKTYGAMTGKGWGDVFKSIDPAVLKKVDSGNSQNPLKGTNFGKNVLNNEGDTLGFLKEIDKHLSDEQRVDPKAAKDMRAGMHEDIRTGISTAMNDAAASYVKSNNVAGGVDMINKLVTKLSDAYAKSHVVREAIAGTPLEALVKEHATTPNQFATVVKYAGDSKTPLKTMFERAQSYGHVQDNLLKNLKNEVAEKGQPVTRELLEDLRNFKAGGRIARLFNHFVTSKFLSLGMREATAHASRTQSVSQQKAFLTKQYLDMLTNAEAKYPNSNKTNGQVFKEMVKDAEAEIAKTVGAKNRAKAIGKNLIAPSTLMGAKTGVQVFGRESKRNIKTMTDSYSD